MPCEGRRVTRAVARVHPYISAAARRAARNAAALVSHAIACVRSGADEEFDECSDSADSDHDMESEKNMDSDQDMDSDSDMKSNADMDSNDDNSDINVDSDGNTQVSDEDDYESEMDTDHESIPDMIASHAFESPSSPSSPTPSPPPRFACRRCPRIYTRKITLEQHIRDRHCGTRCYWPRCGTTTTTEAELLQHPSDHQKHARGVLPTTCPWPGCGKVFGRGDTVQRCLKRHNRLARRGL
ncbi:hypothetical protein HD806DRAFT_474943 [Xylariaceae sp. AK1471]|nr:hypothetical protein HD806DRAFT_474943 [Xylariaceae sp. AK1471]